MIPQPGVLGASASSTGGVFFSFRKIERSEFGEVAWGGGCGRNTGCVKGGLPLVLTLDASRVLRQVEAAAVNSFRFRQQVMRAKGEFQGIKSICRRGAGGQSEQRFPATLVERECAKAPEEHFGNQLTYERGLNTRVPSRLDNGGWWIAVRERLSAVFVFRPEAIQSRDIIRTTVHAAGTYGRTALCASLCDI